MSEGQLSLDFEYDAAQTRTIMHVREQRQPLKVIRAFELSDGAALVHLHNVSGGVLSGDKLGLAVRLGADTCAQLTTTSATRIYRQRNERPGSTQRTHIQVGENALLELLPDPLIPFAGSNYRQSSTIALADGAGLFWWETVAPGREARGELFDYELLELEVEIAVQDRPIALEHARLQPHMRSMHSPARLGDYRYFSTFYVCKVGLPPATWLTLEGQLAELAESLEQPGEMLWGVSTLAAHGLIVRALGCRGRDITSGLLSFWNASKKALYGREAIPPRKVY